MSTRGDAVDGDRKTVGRYEVEREIGRGGMATVYVARQLDLERRVALKELRTLGRIDPSFAQRFLREARLAGSFSHPNIVTVHDYFEHHRVPYIAMEYLARGSLRPYVGSLTLPQVGGVLEGLLAGLAHAETHDVVHRDIKPENLLVTLDGGIKIADFGIAKAAHALESNSLLTAIGTTVGTPNYIAPEQAMGREVGPWTDLYSVGVTAFELLVGRTPFGDTGEPMGIVLRQINEPLPRVSDLVPNVDPWVSDWVAWLVSKEPTDRPQTASQAWDPLEEELLGLVGPRWRREAPLPSLTSLAAGAGGPGSLPLGVAGAAGGVALGAAGLAPSWSKRSTAPAEDPRLAKTVPPVRQPPVAASAAKAGRLRRLPNALKAATMVAVLFAAGGLALATVQGGSMTAGEASNQARLNVAPTEAASAAAPTPLQDGDASLADQVAPARQLALTYDRTATRISKRSEGGAQSRADAQLVSALRRTASAYRAAAAAAASNDLAAYSVALSAAATARQTVSTLLNGSLEGGDSSAPPTVPSDTPSSAPQNSCAGDSTSDDPSDDECSA